MAQPLDRDEIIALLDRLGDDADAEVLDAARALHGRLADTGMTWSDLLAPEESAAADTGADTGADEPAEAGTEMPAGKAGSRAESLALIKKLLARPAISEAFRQEMEGYKSDIAAGTFSDADHQYLRALHKRLTGKG